MLQAADMPY